MARLLKTGQGPASASRDWLPNGHLAWFVHDAVEALEVEALDINRWLDGGRHCDPGTQPCPPRVMLRLLIYSYCTGTLSSRRIAANTEVSIALRVLAAGHAPDHRTIGRFRDENLEELNLCFLQVLESAHEARLVKLGSIAIQSSKAKASKPAAKSDDWKLKEERRLRAEIAQLMRAAKKQDELEDDKADKTDRAAVTSGRSKSRDARIATRRSR